MQRIQMAVAIVVEHDVVNPHAHVGRRLNRTQCCPRKPQFVYHPTRDRRDAQIAGTERDITPRRRE